MNRTPTSGGRRQRAALRARLAGTLLLLAACSSSESSQIGPAATTSGAGGASGTNSSAAGAGKSAGGVGGDTTGPVSTSAAGGAGGNGAGGDGAGGGSAGTAGSTGTAGFGGSAGFAGSGGKSPEGGPGSDAATDAMTDRDGAVAPGDQDLIRYVNPFIGTAPAANPSLPFAYASGDVFPGAAYPLGMLGLSPDTPANLPGGYDYRDTKIKGFSLTHFSGRGITYQLDVPFIPWVGPLAPSPGTNAAYYASTFSHASESASPGYYKVHLDGVNVDVELTTVARAGIERFTFPRGSQATLLVNVGGAINGVTAGTFGVSAQNRTISGSTTSRVGGGNGAPYTVYFVAQFDVPFASVGTWSGGTVTAGSTAANSSGGGAILTFDTSSNNVVQAKVAISYVSLANAQANLVAETPGIDFAAMRAAAAAAWNKRLNLIQVEGGTDDQKTTFYTALYHAFFHPNLFNDSNGQYIGFDRAVHQLPAGRAQYHNIPGWDIHRAGIRLRAILTQDEASDIAQSLVNDAQQGDGHIPRWEQTNADSLGMNGDGGTVIVASAYAFGARDFDARAALQAAIAGQSKVRENGAEYISLGYMAQESANNSAAQTMEYATADAAIAQLAKALGDTPNQTTYAARGRSWMKLFNPAVGYLQPRRRDGTWPASFSPSIESDFQEGSAAQYLWMVTTPHDLVGLLGGAGPTITRLDTYFTRLNEGPASMYAFMGNEPDFQGPWIYDFVGAPAKACLVNRRIQNELFLNRPGGLPGNDDAGSLSSWYVFSMMGIYPFYPGVGGFVVHSPAFNSTTVRLKGGLLKILAPAAAPNRPYVQGLKVDGSATTNLWIPWDRVAGGATLEFDLTDSAASTWGTAPTDAPPPP